MHFMTLEKQNPYVNGQHNYTMYYDWYTGAFVAYGICFINPTVVNKIELEMGEGRISGPWVFL